MHLCDIVGAWALRMLAEVFGPRLRADLERWLGANDARLRSDDRGGARTLASDPSRHVVVCAFEASGEKADKAEAGVLSSSDLREALERRGVEDDMISSCTCVRPCIEGPIMLVFPEGACLRRPTRRGVEALLDRLGK